MPVFGIGSAWLVLGETPGALELIGAAVVIGGLGLVTAALRLPRAAAPRRLEDPSGR